MFSPLVVNSGGFVMREIRKCNLVIGGVRLQKTLDESGAHMKGIDLNPINNLHQGRKDHSV